MTDYGNPDKMADFEYLLTYSPLHNVNVPSEGTRQHPAVLLTSGAASLLDSMILGCCHSCFILHVLGLAG